MLGKLWLMAGALCLTAGVAFAQVDINKADQVALDGVKGIGPKTSKTILDERKKGGEFKDWADFEKRVKGVGGKSAIKLSAAGLRINGQVRALDASGEKDVRKAKKEKERVATADAKK